LAVDAVTSNDYLGWLFWKRERDSTATASSASHRNAPIDSEQAKLTAKYFDIPNSKLRHYPKMWDVRIWQILLQKSAVIDDVARPFYLGQRGWPPTPTLSTQLLRYAIHRP
jgi:hypothetical protein